MKLAILLFGLSKFNHRHIAHRKRYNIDYNASYENYKQYIFDFFEKKGYQTDVYFSTNILNKEDTIDIVEKYTPVKYSFIESNFPDKNKPPRISRNKKLDSVIDLCLENNKEYDLVLITRFDLLFKKDFEKSNIQLDKFNLVSMLEHTGEICDNFYLFPYKYLKDFSEIVKKNMKECFHNIKNDIDNIVDVDFVNYILNEKTMIQYLSFYKIVRKKIQPQKNL